MSIPAFSDFGGLICPHCGGGDMHQRTLTVYGRREDEEQTRVTVVGHDGMLQHSAVAPSVECDNPSARRHGLRLSLECEHCLDYPQLLIYQEKGVTYLQWEEHENP